MFFELASWSWILAAVVFAVGGGAGYFLARQIKDKRTLALELQLKQSQDELGHYRDDVNRHFLKTSLLFNRLTDDYREVYNHLASGAEKLCQPGRMAANPRLPERDILAMPGGTRLDATSETYLEEDASGQVENPSQTKASTAKSASIEGIDEGIERTEEPYPDAPPDDVQIAAEHAEDDVYLGEESAPAVDIHQDKRAIH